MARLTSDPNLAVCPDFASEDYAEAGDPNRRQRRQRCCDLSFNQLMDGHQQLDKRIWARQIQTDLDQAAEAERQAWDLWERKDEQRRHEAELTAVDDWKKNKAKYQEVSEEAPPVTVPDILPAYATIYLQKGQYVALWHFTNESMAWGFNAGPINQNALTQAIDSGGNVYWTPTSTAHTDSPIPSEAAHGRGKDRPSFIFWLGCLPLHAQTHLYAVSGRGSFYLRYTGTESTRHPAEALTIASSSPRFRPQTSLSGRMTQFIHVRSSAFS
ncbi:hypothetical protein H0H87_004418 [Tephrocybe sp. NHM501043]|nr:hypothetical protein H0H87_004418 [Tephrocybe sp. NHM501043]